MRKRKWRDLWFKEGQLKLKFDTCEVVVEVEEGLALAVEKISETRSARKNSRSEVEPQHQQPYMLLFSAFTMIMIALHSPTTEYTSIVPSTSLVPLLCHLLCVEGRQKSREPRNKDDLVLTSEAYCARHHGLSRSAKQRNTTDSSYTAGARTGSFWITQRHPTAN